MSNFLFRKYPALKNKDFRKFLLSQLLSLTGGYIQNVTLSAYITESNEKITRLGLFLFVSYLPVFLLSYFTGRLCNKIRPIIILRVTEIILLCMTAYLVFFGIPEYRWLVVFGGVWGVVRAFQTPASSSMPKLLCNSDDLKSGVSTLSFVTSFSRATGPVIAGVLYTAFDYKASVIANCISYLPSILLLFKIKPESCDISKKGKVEISIPMLILVFVLSLSGTSYNIIFTGLTKKLSLSPVWFSVFMSLVGVGAFFGVLIFRKSVFSVSLILSGSAVLLSFLKTPVTICLVIVIYGLCDYLFFTSALTKLQSDNTRFSLPKAMGIYTCVTTGALPLGYLLQSYVSQSLGISFLLISSGVLISVCYLLIFSKMR